MHADPNPLLLVGEDVHIVVSRPDRSQLLRAHAEQFALRLKVGVLNLLKHGVVYRLGVGPSHSESDQTRNVVHDRRHVDVFQLGVCQDCLVSASDVVADSAWRDMVFVRDGTTDRLAVTDVMVGAKYGELCFLCAGFKLLESPFVDGPECL